MTEGENINIEAIRKTLLDRQAELERLTASSAESREIVELDQTLQGRLSRIDAMQQQEMAKETERRRQIEQQRIVAALKRVDEGNYGYCVQCDEDIEPKRLALDPSVPVCIKCAER